MRRAAPNKTSRVSAERREGPAADSRLLEFSQQAGREVSSKSLLTATRAAQRAEQIATAKTPRERFLRAVEMERSGFLDGSVVLLRRLLEEVEVSSDPFLAISIRYFLASFLMRRGDWAGAKPLSEDGVLLAWEHGAQEELELFERLSAELEERTAKSRPGDYCSP